VAKAKESVNERITKKGRERNTKTNKEKEKKEKARVKE
jgi:hypothetical protein